MGISDKFCVRRKQIVSTPKLLLAHLSYTGSRLCASEMGVVIAINIVALTVTSIASFLPILVFSEMPSVAAGRAKEAAVKLSRLCAPLWYRQLALCP